ncbi:FAD-dependent monooxygenase [Gordonia polyisoprenivorans]|uniref:FAD-dependent oxidoreductase n=1 Tax=Gordonia polyisoprenivorans TaxID=84595 RepID=UPI0009E49FC1|nr:NAD(P)/FAD-dependent oxidoreductase [Gordonia polyisoprenivorans]UZF54290.1 FAD-dependent monooxygenase [Gordonia polyisoprenivorans]
MRSVAVVGGGIGGLVLANLLSSTGWPVEVYEGARALPEKGSALGMWPDAMRVFDSLGLADDIRRAGHPQQSAEVRDPGGALLSRIAARGETVMISRVALLNALLTDRVRIHFGTRVTDVGALDHDVIVGADGINSVVREAVTGEHIESRDLDVSVILGEFAGATDMFTEYWGPGRSFGITPLSRDRRDWHAAYRSPRPGAAQAKQEVDDPLGFVAALYESWCGEVTDAIASTIPETVTRYHVRTMPRIGRWYRGNVVLLGDAVHAMAPNLGRGACETILDAEALARALTAVGPDELSDMEKGFRRYQRDRRGSAYRIALASRMMCRAGMLDRGAGVRDLAMRLSP